MGGQYALRSAVLCARGIIKPLRGSRGTTLVAALALTSLIFTIAMICLGRVAVSYSRITASHDQTNALFLAEAGVRRAGQRLLKDRSYAGEKAIAMPTGTFDVTVSRVGSSYAVTSIGRASSAFRRKPVRGVRAVVTIGGPNSFRISNWRED
jgi:Tfp pilus assembly protein PilX